MIMLKLSALCKKVKKLLQYFLVMVKKGRNKDGFASKRCDSVLNAL